MSKMWLSLLAGPLFLLTADSRKADSAELTSPPRTPKHEVTDVYWGVRVVDDYQYLENMADPKVMNWAENQNAYTRAWLDGHPQRASILKRVVELTHSTSPDYHSVKYRGGTYFAVKQQPPKEQTFLVALPSVSSTSGERVLVDPNVLDPTGGTSIDFFVPSLDGAYVAVSLSRGGTEDGTVHVYETATGRELSDRIPRVNGGTAGGSVAWNADGTGFYYTRYPHEGERPAEDLPFYQQVYFHRLGQEPSADTYVLGREFPKIAECELQTGRDGKRLLVDVSNGDGGEHGYWLLSEGKAPVEVARFEDNIVEGHLGPDGAGYFLSRQDAPQGKILRLDLGEPELARAAVVVPQGEASIEGYAPTSSRLYVIEMVGGPSRVRAYDLTGRSIGVVERAEISSFSSLVETEGDGVLVRSQSYTSPPAYYRLGPDSLMLAPTALAYHSPADFGDCEVRREFARADDGVLIPVNILLRKGTPLDGRNPTLLYAYGSYGLSSTPGFDADRQVWLEQGGIYAVANIRGGGEFGEAWHKAAYLEKKKTSMDDMAACARYLIQRGYTSRERLAIEGGSAGGLLVYGVMVHYPDLMRAVVARVGYGDVLRTELSPNGLFNTTEFGTVEDERQFKGMYAYSPYHQVKDGVRYPALLGMTGLNDPRVEPWQSFKMVARVQATGSPGPILLRTSAGTGHGGGTALSLQDQQTADVYTFLFDLLGVDPLRPPLMESPAP